jgi:cell division protein FtsB
MLAFVCLAIVWAFFLVPPVLRKRREGRPASSVVSFRRQLSTLERATPGTSLTPLQPYQPQPVVGSSFSAHMTRSQVKQRRKNVLIGLLGAVGVSFLLVVAGVGALATLMLLASVAALGAYVYALVQLRMRAEEAAAKVRVLRPEPAARPAAQATVRRVASR